MKSLVEVAPNALKTLRQHASKEYTRKVMPKETFLRISDLIDMIESVIESEADSHQGAELEKNHNQKSVA